MSNNENGQWKKTITGLQSEWLEELLTFLTAYAEYSSFPASDIRFSKVFSMELAEWAQNLSDADTTGSLIRFKGFLENSEGLFLPDDFDPTEFEKLYDLTPEKSSAEEALACLYDWWLYFALAFDNLQEGRPDMPRGCAFPFIIRFSNLVTRKMYEFIGYWGAEMKKKRISQKNPMGRKEKNLKKVDEAMKLHQGEKGMIPKIMLETGLSERTVRDHIKAIRGEK